MSALHHFSKKGIGDKLLEVLLETAERQIDLLSVFLNLRYGAPYPEWDRALREQARARIRRRNSQEKNMAARHHYAVVLSRLQADGLISITKKGKDKHIALTAHGKNKAMQLKTQPELPHFSASESSPHFTIIVFDIPERDRRKRDWLRYTLRDLGFTMLQKSVWIGKVLVPRELLDALRKLHIIDCVEILEITKTGSLRHIA